MSLVYTKVKPGAQRLGNLRITPIDLTLDSSYPSGGYTLAPGKFGGPIAPSRIQGIRTIGGNAASAGYKFHFDAATYKLRVRQGGGAAINAYSPGGGDIKGSANTDVAIASGTLPTNGGLISTLATAANTTTMTIAVSPDVPRNISVSFKNTNAGSSTGNAVSCVITGTFRGAAQTETISFSALELTSTVQNEVATKYGSKPFDTVTSVTNPVAQPANWQHAVGIGSKLGLPTDLLTPIEADVTKITKTAANLAVTGLVSTTNMTVLLGTLTDGDDVAIEYKQQSTAGEVVTGTDLSAVIPRLEFVTK